VNKIPYFKYSKKQIYYEINESKSDGTIIFIHGSGEYSFVWEPQLKNLDMDMDLIAIDLPSHGKSDKFEKLDLNIYVEVVQKLIEELEIKKAVLCGHSLGGAVAQQFYFDHPERVVGLILCSTGAKLRVLPVILENTLHNFNTFLNNVPVGAFYRKTKEEIKRAYVEEVSKIEPQVVHDDFKICDNFDVMDKIDSINVPCLVLVGNADKLTPVKYSKFFDDTIENSTLKVIEDAGHSVMLEKPDHVNKAIKNFVQKKIKNF
jgi:pimeloyl-ACP methyl ester carboxylesterase